MAVANGSGENVHLSEKGEKMWRIAWKSAEVLADGETKVGNMTGVTGETFETVTRGAGKAETRLASRFDAETAEADSKVNRLILKGKVKISATNGTMLADRVEYDATRAFYKATGNVTFERIKDETSEGGLIGPMDSLYATSHTDAAGKAILDKVGTSENYFKK